MPSYSSRHKDIGGRRDDDRASEKRRPSVNYSEYMPQIREGELEYSRSAARPIPHAKSQARHDYTSKSSHHEPDFESGSMHSPLVRTSSNTSSVRRNSNASFYDDGKSDIDGSLGWRSTSSSEKEGRDSYFPATLAGRRPSMTSRTSERDIDYNGSYSRGQDESRYRKKDVNGSYGWEDDMSPTVKLDLASPYKHSTSQGGRHGDRRYHESDSKGLRRH